MKMIKKYIAICTLLLLLLPFCQGQSMKYRDKIRPNVKAKLDSLYPHATGIILDQSSIHDTTQILSINCNCLETSGMIVLQFDTNGNLLNKDVHFHSIKDLPDTIVSYMKKNTSPKCGFATNFMIKSINNKGNISYSIMMWESPGSWSRSNYILKFKSSGEIISKKSNDFER